MMLVAHSKLCLLYSRTNSNIMVILSHWDRKNYTHFPCNHPRRYTSLVVIDSSLFHVTFLTTGRTDSQHLTSPTSFSHTGSGPHVSAGPTIILVVIRSRVGTGNRQESCGVIKGLSLASLNSLAPCWRRAYTELMGLGREGRGEKEGRGPDGKKHRMCVYLVSGLAIPVRTYS